MRRDSTEREGDPYQQASREAVSEAFSELDTTRRSLIHAVCLPRGYRGGLTAAGYLVAYFVTVCITYGIPAVWALLTQDVLLKPRGAATLPYFLDLNIAAMCLVSTPLLLILILRESQLIPKTLAQLAGEGVVVGSKTGAVSLSVEAKEWFGKANVLSQIAGVALAAIMAGLWYPVGMSLHGQTWQTIGAPANSLNTGGWLFIFLQVGPFFFLLAQFLSREIATVILLHRVAARCEVTIKPLHPDRAGGLKPVSRIGLHYQGMVAAIGIHVGALLGALNLVSGRPFYSFIGVLALVAYSILAPLSFMLPLVPFRRHMVRAKHADLQRIAQRFEVELDRILARIDSGDVSGEELDRLRQIRGIHDTVAEFPEWPFDVSTLRKLGATFITPALSLLLSWLLGRFAGGP